MNYLRIINELVKNKNLTNVDVAKILNRDRNTAKYYLTGSTPMRVEDLLTLARNFKIHPGNLLDEDYTPPPNPDRDKEFDRLQTELDTTKQILNSKNELIESLKNQVQILSEQVQHFKMLYEKFSANE